MQAEGAKSASAPTSGGKQLFMNLPTFVRRLLMRTMFKILTEQRNSAARWR